MANASFNIWVPVADTLSKPPLISLQSGSNHAKTTSYAIDNNCLVQESPCLDLDFLAIIGHFLKKMETSSYKLTVQKHCHKPEEEKRIMFNVLVLNFSKQGNDTCLLPFGRSFCSNVNNFEKLLQGHCMWEFGKVLTCKF